MIEKLKNISVLNLIIAAVFIEGIIFGFSYFTSESLAETFKYAARYSGRLAWLLYFLNFSLFIFKYEEKSLRNLLIFFAFTHYIHLYFLFMNVRTNAVELIPYKLAGGALAYLMILILPILYNNLQKFLSVYFYYLGIVIIMTYLARIRGEFEGAEPSIFHYVGLISVATLVIIHVFKKYFFSSKL